MPHREPFFGNFILLIALLVLIICIFSFILRKVLKVERRKLISQDYLNELHKKGDRTIRILYTAVSLVLVFVTVSGHVQYDSWLVIGFAVVFLIMDGTFRAIMEWKFKKGHNDYLYTFIQMIFLLAVFYFAFTTEGFGLFNL
ncbi:DUF4181 domain-containing protein [Virgibacillus kekensis]|uniref:DUF4181 domain-containing protein n=1 Tax=Virgibacillus kekensis TaxID=202261 RepID=A0ABV9DHS0_9BACI